MDEEPPKPEDIPQQVQSDNAKRENFAAVTQTEPEQQPHSTTKELEHGEELTHAESVDTTTQNAGNAASSDKNVPSPAQTQNIVMPVEPNYRTSLAPIAEEDLKAIVEAATCTNCDEPASSSTQPPAPEQVSATVIAKPSEPEPVMEHLSALELQYTTLLSNLRATGVPHSNLVSFLLHFCYNFAKLAAILYLGKRDEPVTHDSVCNIVFSEGDALSELLGSVERYLAQK